MSGSIRLAEETPNKHQLKTDEMRRKLLKSAYRVFAQVGFEAARLEDIAQQAGHTRGALYAHFTSKEDLFFALFEQEIYRQLEKVQLLVNAELTYAAKVQVLRGHYVAKLNDSNWSLLMLEFKMFAIRHPRKRAKLAAAYRAMRASTRVKGLSDLICRESSGSAMSLDATRIVLESLLQGLILARTYDPLSLSGTEAGEALKIVFDSLIEAETKGTNGDVNSRKAPLLPGSALKSQN